MNEVPGNFGFAILEKFSKKKNWSLRAVLHAFTFKKFGTSKISENFFCIFRRISENNEKHEVNPGKKMKISYKIFILEKFWRTFKKTFKKF